MMKKLLLCLMLLLFALPCFSAYVPGEILVSFKSGAIVLQPGAVTAQDKDIKVPSIIQLNRKHGAIKVEKAVPGAKEPKEKIKTLSTGKIIEVPDLSKIYKITFPKEIDIEKVLSEYRKDPNVEYAEPNYILHAFKTPNDPYYESNQWYLQKIQAPQAWDISTGESSAIVAVIDTGVDYTHEDLQGKIILGHNYVNTSPGHVQNPDLPMDDYGHGTHVSGAIAALTNNSKGIAGLNWNGKIYAVKVLDYAGSGNISDIISGMTEAVNYGVKILNLSLGDANYSPSLENAVNYAYANGCLVVAAAGNENTNTPTYPAAFTNAFAVASTDQNDQRSVWNSSAASNYGSWVDISAPGSMIYSTWLSNSYTYKNGTSMATPLVSGLASLLLGRKPNWTPDQLRDRIQSTSDNIDGLNPGYAGQLGTGRINAGRALGMPRAQITNPASGSFVSGTVSIKGDADSMDFANYMVFVGFGSNPTSYLLLYTNNTQVINDTLYNFDSTQVADGWQTIKLSAMSNEPYTVEATVSVIVDNTKPTAIISNPADSQTVEGTVTISGTANDTNFEYYTIEYSKDSSNYFRISTSTSPQINDDLASWNTEGLSGKYFIRLTVADKANNTSQTVIEVNIASSSANKVSVMGISRPTPNPFNPATQSQTYFSYYLSQNSDVAIYLFNLSGELIWQKSYFSGEEGGKAQLNLAPWNGINLYGEIVENGVYIYKITASGDGGRKVLDSGKIIVLKN